MAIEDTIQPTTRLTKGVSEVAPILHVSPRTLRRWAENREIGHYKCGRQIFFSDQDIAAFMTKSRVSANH